MVPGDAIGADQSGDALCPRSGRELLNFLRTGCSVIRTGALTGDVSLKFASIFSEIMEQSDEASETAGAEFLRSRGCQSRHLLQMRAERLPFIRILTLN